jgi:hypothetical protein
MAYESFDDLDSPLSTEAVVPFQFREDKSQEGTLQWLNDRFDRVYESAFPRFIMYRRFLNYYKNVSEDQGDGLTRTTSRYAGANSSKKPKMRDNIIWDLVDQKTAEVSKSSTKVAFIPQSYFDQDDINNAKACKILTQSRVEEMHFDQILTKQDTIMFLFGHTISEVCWDEKAGPLNDKYVAQKKRYGGKVPKVDPETGLVLEGKYLEDEDMHLGDWVIKPLLPWYCFPEEEKKSLKECDYFETVEWKFKEEVEADYPKAKGKIKQNGHVQWDMSNSELNIPDNMVLIRTFWHKPTKYFPLGCKITYCNDLILEDIDFPYEDKELPFVEDKDISIPDEFWGRPFIINIEQYYRMNNSLLSSQARNHGVASAPKWVYAEGSVDKQSLNNDFGGIAFRGPIAPQMVINNSVNRGEMEIAAGISSRTGKLARLFDTSRGEVPSGVTAASALRLLEDQQYTAMSVTIANRKQRVLDLYRMGVKRMAQYYKPEDGRMSRILGSNNSYLMNSFAKFDFNMIYDLRTENKSALSDNAAGRMAELTDLSAMFQADPLFNKKEMVKLLQLNNLEAFQDETTYSIDTARQCLDMMLNGEQAPAPEMTDGLIEFYGVFSRFVESPEYKFIVRPETKGMIMDYINAIEMLSYEKSVKNPKFAAELGAFAKYPMVFSPPPLSSPQNPSLAQPTNPDAQASTAEQTAAPEQLEAIDQQQGEF